MASPKIHALTPPPTALQIFSFFQHLSYPQMMIVKAQRRAIPHPRSCHGGTVRRRSRRAQKMSRFAQAPPLPSQTLGASEGHREHPREVFKRRKRFHCVHRTVLSITAFSQSYPREPRLFSPCFKIAKKNSTAIRKC